MSTSSKSGEPLTTEPQKPSSDDPAGITSSSSLAPEDFYFEGPYLVFTEAYHLKRGYCCNSGCRHCPFHQP